jgi:hypothetical protein
MGQILPAGKEPDKRSALVYHLVTNCPPQHRVTGFERLEDGVLRDLTLHLQVHLTVDTCKCPQMGWKDNSNRAHGNAWISTDNTGGRSRTIGIQLSPESAEA